ncbi:MAG: potassium channel family protein [Myxococcota bacterium]
MSIRIRRTPKTSRWRARGLFALYGFRLLAPRLFALAALVIGGGLFVKLRLEFTGAATVDLVTACYEVYTQLFFEHVSTLPQDPALRVLYFVIPLLGALVLAEGLFKLGASLLDFQNHRDQWMRIMAQTYTDHVVLLGLGHVGFRVLEELAAREVPVVVIEAADGGLFVEEARARGVPLLIGDARRESLLQEVGIGRAAALIACTDNDLVNLEAALDARQLNPTIRLVMRMFDQSMAQKIKGAFALDATFSTSALSAPVFAAAALDETVLGAYRLGDTTMVTVAVPIVTRGALAGRPVAELGLFLDATIVGVQRLGHPPTHRFSPAEVLGVGDSLLCHVPLEQAAALQERALAPAA